MVVGTVRWTLGGDHKHWFDLEERGLQRKAASLSPAACLRVIGEELIKCLEAAGMKRDLAAFEPAFRRVFPAKK